MKNKNLAILVILGTVVYITMMCISSARAADRCQNFIVEIRSNSIRYLGLEYPWWYNLGCAMTETNCRQDLVSFDGGIGLFQLTPSTGIVAVIQKEFPVNPYNAESNIRAQAFYMHLIKDKYMQQKSVNFKNKYQISPLEFTNKCGVRLSDLYRHYNGGYWFIHESKLAGKNKTYDCDEKDMKSHCVRGGTWVGSGDKKRWLSFCEVNYSYAEKVHKYGQKYKSGPDGIGYWEAIKLPQINDKKEKEIKPETKPEQKPIHENPKPEIKSKSCWQKIKEWFNNLFK